MKKLLTKVWKTMSAEELAYFFKNYMVYDLNAKQVRHNTKDYTNSYRIDGNSSRWNKVYFDYYKGKEGGFGNEDLEIIFRQRAGDYLIICRKRERAFEVDEIGIKGYDEKLLKEIVADHKPLFDMLEKYIKDR